MLRKVTLLASACLLAACQTVQVPDQGKPPKSLTPAKTIQGKWIIESIADRGVIDYLQMQINFKDNGQVSGFAGCNRFLGRYQFGRSYLNVKKLATTRKMCAPAIMHQEKLLISELKNPIQAFQLKPGVLILESHEGRKIRLVRE